MLLLVTTNPTKIYIFLQSVLAHIQCCPNHAGESNDKANSAQLELGLGWVWKQEILRNRKDSVQKYITDSNPQSGYQTI